MKGPKAFVESADGENPFVLSSDPAVGDASLPLPPAQEEELDELPETYNTQALYLVACDPGRVFAYWDLDWSQFGQDETVAVRLHRADGELERSMPIHRLDAGHFSPVEEQGGTYFAEVAAGRGETWRTIARSGLVTVPPAQAAPEGEAARYATVPASQSFAQLGHLLAPFAATEPEGLVEIIARLQQEFVTHGSLPVSHLSVEQRSSLESIFRANLKEIAQGLVSAPSAVIPSESSELFGGLAALRALIEGAPVAARDGRPDAASHAVGELPGYPDEWELWRRAVLTQFGPGGVTSSPSESLSSAPRPASPP